MTEKQQQLTFEKGITNVPSDVLCSDNALSDCVGLVYADGEHRVVQRPAELLTLGDGEVLLYVHSVAGRKNYIVYNGGERDVGFRRDGSTTVVFGEDKDEPKQVQSIGKTLIVLSGDGLIDYYLWNGGTYTLLGDIPVPEVEFFLSNYSQSEAYSSYLKTDGILDKNGGRTADQEKFNDFILGMYAELKKNVSKQRKFMNPFFVRAALELYDGTFIKPTAPVLLWPTIGNNCAIEPQKFQSVWDDDGEGNTSWSGARLKTIPKDLNVILHTDYSIYHDIVKGVVVFVTREIDPVDVGENQKMESGKDIAGIYATDENWARKTFYVDGYNVIGATTLKSRTEIFNDMLSATAVFYRIANIRMGSNVLTETIEKSALENLTTQQQLTSSGYYDLQALYAKGLYTYNNRLNLIGVERGFFAGFSQFCSYGMTSGTSGDSGKAYYIYVTIETDSGERVVCKEVRSGAPYEILDRIDIWFFYPDTRATRYEVFNEAGDLIHAGGLKEHPYLHGSYYLNRGEFLPSKDFAYSLAPGVRPEEVVDNEVLDNTIITSEVNNPFTFKAEGYNSIGSGSVIGVSTQTQALSEGQFGQYPLLAFCTDGIWALSVASTGYYTSIHPISREVCNNARSITQTDGAVFFSSKKGLMVVVGSQVRCVSDQLSGKAGGSDIGSASFSEYLEDGFIAYDYRDSLLWIFNPGSGFEEYCYIYAMKSGTFSKFYIPKAIGGVVVDYPDCLLRGMDGTIYSLMERDNMNSDEGLYAGMMETRPMKFENGLALKSLMQVRHVKDMSGVMTLRIFASNNLVDWLELRSLRGCPWKYYRFRYDFEGMRATDRFAGSVVVTQERRTEKLR